MKKGFTLIELLAVIVILAVIALIASPIIIGLIDNTRKEAFKNTGYGIIDAGKLLYSKELLKGTNEEVKFTYNEGVEETSTGKTLDYNGSKPNSGTVLVNGKGQVAIAIHNEKYCAKKGYFDDEVILTEETQDNCNIPLYDDNTGAPIPELTTGMIPVVYDGTNWIKATVIDKWYNYNEKEWANAVTVNNAVEEGTGSDGVPRHSREYYLNTLPVGSPISMDDINTMWVWIPRYKYRLFERVTYVNRYNPPLIEIAFESKNTITVPNSYAVGEWLTHPAFWWDNDSDGVREAGEEISGIWVGKFETSSTNDTICYSTPSTTNCMNVNPVIKPNVSSLRYQNISTQFATAQKFNNNPIYGFSTDGDIHMAKDSEWGAAAYLSHSQYGINGEVYKNNSGGSSGSFFTGRSGGNVGGSQVKLDVDGVQTESITTGFYTYDGKCATTTDLAPGIAEECTAIGNLLNDKTLAYKASTTGNIYGIYDMSGGAFDITMGMYRPLSGTVTDSSGFGATTDDGSLPETKYWNRYTNTDHLLACNGGICYGNALAETYSEYGDNYSDYINGSPWSVRGANYGDKTVAGVFAIYRSSGSSAWYSSFRVIQLKP